jgi:hypothetical protein
MRRLITYITSIAVIAIAVLFVSAAHASLESQAVGGNTFSCYIYTPLDLINTEISFTDGGQFSIQEWQGNGVYLAITSLFMGAFWAVDVTLTDANSGETMTGDIIIIFAGTTIGPFIAGAGALIFEYEDVYGMGFLGIQKETVTD